jgi:hypothetical protein
MPASGIGTDAGTNLASAAAPAGGRAAATELPGLAVTATAGLGGGEDGQAQSLMFRPTWGGAGAAAGGASASSPAAGTGSGPVAPTPENLSIHISRAAQAGTDRIEIDLEPLSLGRIEVRLDLGRDGRLGALVLAETPETLELLKADARALEQSLRDAGLKTDAGSLHFDLRGDHHAGGHNARNAAPGASATPGRAEGDDGARADAAPAVSSPARAGDRQLDLLA